MRKKIINWEQAARDRVPCYFWNDSDDLTDPTAVDRLLCNNEHCTQTVNGNDYEHCELILPSDKEKYTEIIYEGRENFIAALKEGVKMKVEVTPELSEELQEIAFDNDFSWLDGHKKIILTEQSLIFFGGPRKEIYLDSESNEVVEYLPETDNFKRPASEYRKCKNIDEFRPFLGKIAKHKTENKEILITFSDSYAWRNYFSNYDLINPINNSTIIGVINEND